MAKKDHFSGKELFLKRIAKDSVFCNLFSDPENQLKLYHYLHPEDKSVKASDFNTVTIQNIMTDQIYNDLGFTVRDRLLILAEAQSKWSVNILVRILMYMAYTLKEYIVKNNRDVYNSKKIEMPEPEFYVIYTGTLYRNR